MWVYTLLPKILNMSLTASIVIVLVLIARILLKKAPKAFSYTLWAVVLFRLVCPVSFSSEFSLIGLFHLPASTANGSTYSSITYIPDNIVHTKYPQVDLPIPIISEVINDNLPQSEEQLVADPLEWPMAAVTILWLFGIAAMLIYSAVSLILLRRKLIGAVRLRDNIYLADHIITPFVIGLIRPKIYLPSTLTEQEQSYIILHEQTHIRRLDHIFKMIAFLALAMHWFNPLVWVAFVYCVKDMEMSCDERVLKKMGGGIKTAYSTSLISLATGRRLINGSPLAFGEGNIKGRIKNVMNFKKPAAWVIAISVVLVATLSVGFAVNRVDNANMDNRTDMSFELGTFYSYDVSGELTASYDSGNSFSIDEQGRVSISYEDGTVAKSPLILNTSELHIAGMEKEETGFYISPRKTVIAYGGDVGPVQVLISDDMGKTWSTYAVEGSDYNRMTKLIGFRSDTEGWLLASPGVALGTSHNYIYLTHDGGKSWTEIGNPNEVYSRVATGVGFSTEDIGFVGFRYETDFQPAVYWTQDGGKTWEPFNLELPKEFDEYSKTPMSPVFSGAYGTWPISMRLDEDKSTIYLTSEDYGRTWSYTTTPLASDIAEETKKTQVVIPLESIKPYAAPEVKISTTDIVDIKEILTKLTVGKTNVYFYRAQNDDIYGAYTTKNGDIGRFITVYDASEHSGYQDGFSIEDYEGLFGRDGFIMGYSIGAAYHAFEYYYLDNSGNPAIMAQCYNNHTVVDLDKNGDKELATFYSVFGSPYIYFTRDGVLYMADVLSIVKTAFPEWQVVSSDSKVNTDSNGNSWINLYYSLEQGGELNYCAITFTPDALTVDTDMR